MQSKFEQVVASYNRARDSGELFDSFYELFLSKSPDIPPMFAHTDFTHQKRMLRESILEMLVYFRTQSGEEEIRRLAERHRKINVKNEHYELWLDALCEAISKHDPEFSPELEQSWRDAFRPAIEIMTRP
jgi:hemoglobin-like flavoprotein